MGDNKKNLESLEKEGYLVSGILSAALYVCHIYRRLLCRCRCMYVGCVVGSFIFKVIECCTYQLVVCRYIVVYVGCVVGSFIFIFIFRVVVVERYCM